MTSYAHHHSSPVKGETMEALKGSCQTDEGAEDVAATSGPALWGLAERDDFSVEDLLDLEEFGEADKDEHLEAPPVVKEDRKSSEKDGSQQSSIVSFELVTPLPPPPEIVDLPAHDVEELEWVSCIMDDSLAEPPPLPQPPSSVTASLGSRPPQHRPPLPRSQDGVYRPLTLASNPLRRPAICVVSTEALVPVKAKRSKQARASGWSLSCVAPFFDSSSSSTATSLLCSSSASFSPFFRMDSPNLASSNLLEDYHTMPPPNKKYKHCKNSKPKKRGRKPKNSPTHPSGAAAGAQGPGDRHCGHCGIQKTPQWREGPEGAKTLCNACGVRYKSGRLFPEYRPASSPTFMSAVHSNSHRKVLEMRLKKVGGPLAPTAPALA